MTGDRREIHGAPASAAITDVAYVAAESRRLNRGGRFLRRPDGHRSSAVRARPLAHERRRIVHVAVTSHPTAAWTAQQFREAFPWDQAPHYLIHESTKGQEKGNLLGHVRRRERKSAILVGKMAPQAGFEPATLRLTASFYDAARNLSRQRGPFLLADSWSGGNPRPPDSSPRCPDFVPISESGF